MNESLGILLAVLVGALALTVASRKLRNLPAAGARGRLPRGVVHPRAPRGAPRPGPRAPTGPRAAALLGGAAELAAPAAGEPAPDRAARRRARPVHRARRGFRGVVAAARAPAGQRPDPRRHRRPAGRRGRRVDRAPARAAAAGHGDPRGREPAQRRHGADAAADHAGGRRGRVGDAAQRAQWARRVRPHGRGRGRRGRGDRLDRAPGPAPARRRGDGERARPGHPLRHLRARRGLPACLRRARRRDRGSLPRAQVQRERVRVPVAGPGRVGRARHRARGVRVRADRAAARGRRQRTALRARHRPRRRARRAPRDHPRAHRLGAPGDVPGPARPAGARPRGPVLGGDRR